MSKFAIADVFRQLAIDSSGGLLTANNIIRANQNKILPDAAFFATYQITLNDAQARWAEVLTVNNISGLDIDETVNQRVHYTVDLNYFSEDAVGASAFDTLANLTTFFHTTAAKEFMTNSGVGLITYTGVIDVTELENTKFEDRANLQIECTFILSITSLLSEIQTEKVNGEYQQGGIQFPIALTVDQNSG